MSIKVEYGDFQTPDDLAHEVVKLVDGLFPSPNIIVEPTAGLGSFLSASHTIWGMSCDLKGYEINPSYVRIANERLASHGTKVVQQDFFSMNWKIALSADDCPRVLVLGNPPWVTNSALGHIGSANLPQKQNFQGLRGFEAKTGKSNFDIAEWMLIRLIESLPATGAIAMLCKTMTARKVLRHIWRTIGGLAETKLFLIDAKHHFDVSVDACLLFALGSRSEKCVASIYSDLDIGAKVSEFGLVDGSLVSNLKIHANYKDLDGGSPYVWRSGIKHDASKVMEFVKDGEYFVNGFNEKRKLESEYVFPLLKSSDLGNGRHTPRKYVLVTQKRTGDDTMALKKNAPGIWEYLEQHADKLDSRKSSIYLKRSRFCIFGVGEYSFANWKVAISGLYKSIKFVVVPPVHGRPVMIDDTCYSIACKSEEEAQLLCKMLNSKEAQLFLTSLIFNDSKRPVTVDVLNRLSLAGLARRLECEVEYESFSATGSTYKSDKITQLNLALEREETYRKPQRKKTPKVRP